MRRSLESLARLGDYFAYVRREMPWLKSIYFAHADGGAFLTDAQGRPTTDPRAARGGDLLAFARRESRTGAGGKYWYYLVRTPTARVAGPVDEIRDRLYALSGALAKAIDGLSRALTRELLWAGFLALLAAMLAAWLGARTVSRPLTALASAVRRVGRGDFETRVPPGGADEVGEVSRAVNEMIAGLKEGVFVKNTFKSYLSASVVDQIIKDPSSLKLGGEERELTVFFSDMSGFTELSERMEPRKLVSLINEYLSAMTDSIFLQEGTLDNRSRLKELCKDWEKRGLPSFDIRIGINTGAMIVGNVGSAARMEYTVLGDAVNTGSRLEQLNKLYGTHILISEATRDAAGGAVETHEVDLLELRGKKKKIRVYELLGLPGQIPAARLSGYRLYEHGLIAYRERRWDESEAALRSAVAALGEDKSSSILLGLLEKVRHSPPPGDWDGTLHLGAA